jgi:2-polyprenyl-6-methoxyphenol hydroxylase-like FAD-dependent oxidoreductase
MSLVDVPVLVVGGGPAGLCSSILLSRLGVRSLLVERHVGTSRHPKATGVSTRTAELLRQWGLEERVRADALDLAPFASLSATLAAPELDRRSLGYPERDAALAVSPTAPIIVPQDALEPILLEHARGFDCAELRFGTELVAFTQDAHGVRATLRDRVSGAARTVRARYMIAADGVWSPTREALGIRMHGLERIGEYASILFRAELDALVGDRRCALHMVQTSDVPGTPAVLVPTSRDGRWVLATPWGPDREPVAALDAGRLAALVRRAAGVADLAVDVLDARTVALGAAVAERFRDRRVFLVGDAAHRMTPTGGMGMNTAIGDAHNLAWKLAAVLGGWAADVLLDSYGAERMPVAERNVGRSRGQHPEVSGVAADLGVVYRVADDATGAAGKADATEEATRRARLGGRAPHVWLSRVGRPVSPLDLCTDRFVLLAAAGGAAWCGAAELVAVSLGVPLAAYTVGDGGDLADPGGRWRDAYGVGAAGAVLLRPDGHVAWRGEGAADDPVLRVGRALGRALSRPAAVHARGRVHMQSGEWAARPRALDPEAREAR